ncbi:MAG: transglycosylase family protein [Acidimicrobiia bacterium]|nr:transglycosylase family protein [Acidimicrobiia bacterium]
MSRTATGAVFLSALVALIVGPELGFGPITATGRADTRPHTVPQATVMVLVPPFIPQPAPPPPPPAPPRVVAPPRPAAAAAVATGDVWARLRACESPTNGGTRYRGYYQFSQSSWQSVGGSGDPAAAPLEEQTARAQMLAARSDPYHQWPVCWPRAVSA